jgi:hypothetical protein
MSTHNQFELSFQDFVQWFGGTVLPKAPSGYTADYLFAKYEVIAELKSLLDDTSAEINAKVTKIVEEWCKKTGQRPAGRFEGDLFILELKHMPAEIADKWAKILLDSVEHNVRAANKQIRETKLRENMPNAKGVILISNPANTYFSDPESYERLLVEILRKKDNTGNLRYPHIHGGVYFSTNNVRTPDKDMYFWYQVRMKRDGASQGLEAFLDDLQQGWYKFIEETYGIKAVQHPKKHD